MNEDVKKTGVVGQSKYLLGGTLILKGFGILDRARPSIGKAAAETVGKYAYYVKLRRSFSATENKLAASFNEKRHTQREVIGFLFYFHRTFTM